MSSWLRPWKKKDAAVDKDDNTILGIKDEETQLEETVDFTNGDVCRGEALEILEDHFAEDAVSDQVDEEQDPCEIITNEEIQCVKVLNFLRGYINID